MGGDGRGSLGQRIDAAAAGGGGGGRRGRENGGGGGSGGGSYFFCSRVAGGASRYWRGHAKFNFPTTIVTLVVLLNSYVD
jgi:hypothetical protein